MGALVRDAPSGFWGCWRFVNDDFEVLQLGQSCRSVCSGLTDRLAVIVVVVVLFIVARVGALVHGLVTT
jgi:hypothetical protein